MTGAAVVVQGDALHLPLPDASVDLIVTSPPYLWKRTYAINGTGEVGNERNWREYLNNLWIITDEMLRVLKPKGSIFVNLGDTRVAGREPKWLGVPPKSRLLLPERYRVGCQDRYLVQGVIVRQVQIWEKANGLPESTVDRTRDSHEDFVHLVKQPGYYSATDEVREPHAQPDRIRADVFGGVSSENGVRHAGASTYTGPTNPLGKLPGSVWTIPSEPLRLPDHLEVQHYAAFPSEWPRRLILGWSPPGICLECGQGRVPVVERTYSDPIPGNDRGGRRMGAVTAENRLRHMASGERMEATATILGYACSCTPFTDHPDEARGSWTPPPTRPAVILDPFGGTGTVAMVARALGRIGVSVDLSHAYGKAARWRVRHDGAKASSRTNLERQGRLLL